MRRQLISTGVLLCLFGLGISSIRAADVRVGDPVPDFRMMGSDGNWYTADQLRGKEAFVIAWFPKAFTGG